MQAFSPSLSRAVCEDIARRVENKRTIWKILVIAVLERLRRHRCDPWHVRISMSTCLRTIDAVSYTHLDVYKRQPDEIRETIDACREVVANAGTQVIGVFITDCTNSALPTLTDEFVSYDLPTWPLPLVELGSADTNVKAALDAFDEHVDKESLLNVLDTPFVPPVSYTHLVPKVPGVALLDLVGIRIPFLFLILGRRGGGNDGGIYNGALFQNEEMCIRDSFRSGRGVDRDVPAG